MNVIIFMADQYAHPFLGCAGYPGLKTPTYDRLAADGLRFTQATCAVSPCLPTRHSMLHGLYAFQSGIYTNRHLMSVDDIPEWSMGKAFKKAGYVTGAYGKMHLTPYQADVERGSYYGFDHRAGPFHETGERMDSHFVEAHRDWAETIAGERESQGIGQGGDDCAAAFLGYTSNLPLEKTRDWFACSQAADFVDAYKDESFFLMCSLSGPHAPHAVPADYADLYDPDEIELPPEPPDDLPDREAYPQYAGLEREDLRTAIANYMAFVTACDFCHGQVIAALDRHGLYDDMLILFVGDHGELLGSRGVTSFSKYNLYEQAIRIPFILKPPKSFGSGFGTCNDLVNLLDVLPTVFDIAGLETPGHLPGISLKPLLANEPAAREREIALTELGLPKGLFHSIRTQDWKYIHGPHGPELYHLREDPWEFKNLAEDPSCVSQIASLQNGFGDECRWAFDQGSKMRLGYETRPWGVLTL